MHKETVLYTSMIIPPRRIWLLAGLWTLVSPIVSLGMLIVFSAAFVRHIDGGFVEVGSWRFNDILGGPIVAMITFLETSLQHAYAMGPLIYGANILQTALTERYVAHRTIRATLNVLIAGSMFLLLTIPFAMLTASADVGWE